MFKKDPEGYRKLLAYRKACEAKLLTEELVGVFPKTKTFVDLADQMSRSGRSSTKNITEGWKRNTTKEYFDFLGFAIGSNSELMEDAADIATGVYKGLMGIKGLMGRRGATGPFPPVSRPLDPLSPNLIAPLKPLTPLDLPLTAPDRFPIAPLKPLTPLDPIFPFITRDQLDKLPFYPLNEALPPIVRLFLKCKEVNFLLYKLQQALERKMDSEGTKPQSQKAREHFLAEKQADKGFNDYLKAHGLKRLENGQWVQGNKGRNG
jgi:four helix bundle protein